MATNSTSQINRDVDLILRIGKADQKALALLYRLYYPRLFEFIARITRNHDIVEDVINEVMYMVWKKAGSYNHHCQPSTWIFGIAYNKARQAYSKASHSDEESLEELDQDSPFLAENNPGLQQIEVNDMLESAFGALSLDQRAVIELTYFQGWHYGEIAELMECSENTVKTRMYYARKKLALALKGSR